jgi:hypothetical protein
MFMAAGWDQAACHHRHLLCVYFQKRFELNILNIFNVKKAIHCLKLQPLELETPGMVASSLNPHPILWARPT